PAAQRNQPADRGARRARRAVSDRRGGRRAVAFRRRMPRLRHGRRHVEAGYRTHAAHEAAADHGGARRHRPCGWTGAVLPRTRRRERGRLTSRKQPAACGGGVAGRGYWGWYRTSRLPGVWRIEEDTHWIS